MHLRYFYLFWMVVQLGGAELIAQPYVSSLGLRAGNSFGVSLQQYIPSDNSLQLILQNDFKGQTFTNLLFRKHLQLLIFGGNANVFYGGGAHLGWSQNEERRTYPGIDAIIGLEFSLAYLHISLDYKPQLSPGMSVPLRHQFAFSLSYILIKRNWEDNVRRRRRPSREEMHVYNGR